MSLKEKIRANYPGLFAVLKAINKARRIFWHATFEQLGIMKRKYLPFLPSMCAGIKSLKGIHKGEKCFIVATGPSLTLEDLNKLKGHKSISMNSIVMSYDKTDWRPDYYAVQDIHTVDVLSENGCDFRKSVESGKVIVSHMLYRKNKSSVPENTMIYHLDMDGHDVGYEKYSPNVKTIRFSDDCFSHVYDGYTITYSCIQLAVYMGFTEIYLVGVDCNYSGTNDHAFGFNVFSEGAYEQMKKGDILRLRMTAAYDSAKKYADAHRIKIFNATRGGKLEVFPRISLEEALKD